MLLCIQFVHLELLIRINFVNQIQQQLTPLEGNERKIFM